MELIDLRFKGVEDLVCDERIKMRIQSAQSLDEVAEILSENGVDVSAKDIEAALAQESSDELDESSLENVAGGALGLVKYLLPILPLLPTPIIPWRYRK